MLKVPLVLDSKPSQQCAANNHEQLLAVKAVIFTRLVENGGTHMKEYTNDKGCNMRHPILKDGNDMNSDRTKRSHQREEKYTQTNPILRNLSFFQ